MAQSDAMRQLQKNLALLLRSRSMTQRDLAERTSIRQANISRILSGKENVTLDRAERLAKAFDLSLPEMLSDNLEKILRIPA